MFKIFPSDTAYLRFIHFAKRHQNVSAFPRVLGGPWRIVPFYRRAASQPYLYVVKLERLFRIADPELVKHIAGWLEAGESLLDLDGNPHEYNTIRGGETRPKKRPKPQWTPPDDDKDLPF